MGQADIEAYCAVILVLLLPITILIVVYYAEPGFPWYTYISCVLGYYAAFAIMLIVPIDIATVVNDRRSTNALNDPSYNYDRSTLTTIYNIFFTMVLILGSLILSFGEYYDTDGYFTVCGRLGSAAKRMLVDIIVPLIVGVIVLGVLIGQNVVTSNATALKLAAVIVTNTLYEFFLVLLLGYALVEYPRSLWSQSDLQDHLLKVQMKAASEFKAISENQLSVSLVVADVLKTRSALAGYADASLLDAMDIMIKECPPEFRSDRLGKPATNKSGQVTIDTLATLRTKLNIAKDLYKMAQQKVQETMDEAYALEDIVQAKNTPGATTIRWTLLDADSTEAEYNWLIRYRPMLLKLASIICAILSILSLLGVICSMHGVSNNVSVYFLAVHANTSSVPGITLFILLTFGYTVYIAAWAIFQIRLGAASELIAGRTTPEALSFNVRMVARLAAPLAFFYLGWISENGLRTGSWVYNQGPTHVYEIGNVTVTNTTTGITTVLTGQNITADEAIFMPSAFSNFYQLQSIGVVNEVFGVAFPSILFGVMALFALKIFNRLLVCMRLSQYQFGAEIVTEEQLREGRRQLSRHRKGAERRARRGRLQSFITNLTKTNTDSLSLAANSNHQPGLLARLLMALGLISVDPLSSQSANAGNNNRVTVKEPSPLFGSLEKKGAGYALGVGASYREAYGEIRSPGFLHIYRDKRTADVSRAMGGDPSYSNDPAVTIVDLRLVREFVSPAETASASGRGTAAASSSNNSRELELVSDSGESTKLRFRTAEEQARWRQGLSEWKDFNVDYGMIYPMGIPPEGASTATAGEDEEHYTPPTTSNNNTSRGSHTRSTANPAASRLTAQQELDRVVVGDEDDDDGNGDDPDAAKGVRSLLSRSPFYKKGKSGGGGGGGGGFFNFGFGGSGGNKGNKQAVPAPIHEDDKPKPLEGWLDKKGGGHFGTGEHWSKRYLRVDERSQSLIYAKASDPTAPAQGTIDLRVVKDIAAYEKNGRVDSSRFNIDLGDKVFKFKATSEAEGQRWVEGLHAWRDYFLLNM
jgi:hypothetical protein